MSLYAAYFVPNGTDAYGLQGATSQPAARWKSGGAIVLKDLKLTKYDVWGEHFHPSTKVSHPIFETAYNNPITKKLYARTFRDIEFSGMLVLEGVVECCNGVEIAVSISARFDAKIATAQSQMLPRFGMYAKALYLPGWAKAISYADMLSDAGIDAIEFFDAMNSALQAKNDLSKLYTVVDNESARVRLSPALICLAGNSSITVNTDVSYRKGDARYFPKAPLNTLQPEDGSMGDGKYNFGGWELTYDLVEPDILRPTTE